MVFNCRLKNDFEHELNRLCSNQLHKSLKALKDDLSGEYCVKCNGCPMDNSQICNEDEISIEDVEKLQKWSDKNNINFNIDLKKEESD